MRIEAYGTVDELNAALGVCTAADRGRIAGMLGVVQNELFTVGSMLARLAGTGPRVEEKWISRLETEIDVAEGELSPLRAFILPGGCELSARLHFARTVARRAERGVVALSRESSVDPLVVKYLNRLSDWLFVQARLCNHVAGVADIPWKAR